jgi:sigma-B regulation protein RsbU (phosphoserine phosphatase)
VLNTSSGELLYSNGGHPPALLLRAGGGVEALPGRGRLVGALEGSYQTRSARLEPGDLLFLYSDGITEARNGADALFTAPALEAVLRDVDRSSAESVVRGVVEEVERFAGAAPPSDDRTALTLRFEGKLVAPRAPARA